MRLLRPQLLGRPGEIDNFDRKLAHGMDALVGNLVDELDIGAQDLMPQDEVV
jgi:hypothetical protein